MSAPVLVRIEESGDDECAFVDGRPIEPGDGESAREAALRVVLADATEPRVVDIHMPSGVVLHVAAGPAGRLRVLGQTSPRATADGHGVTHPAAGGDDDGEHAEAEGGEQREADGIEAAERARVAAAVAAEARYRAGLARPDGGGWEERDASWPDPVDTARRTRAPRARARHVPPPLPASPPPPAARECETDGAEPVGPRHDAGADVTAGVGADVTAGVGADVTAGVGAADAIGPAGPPAHLGPTAPGDREMPADPRPFAAQDRDGAAQVDGGPIETREEHPEDAGPDGDPAEGGGRAPRRRWVIPTVFCAVLGLGGLAAVAVHHADPAPAAEPVLTGRAFPQSAPDGWDARASWASPPIDRASRVAVSRVGSPAAGKARRTSASTSAAAGASVAYVTATRAMSVVDATTGRARWSTSLPEGELRTGPAITHIGGVEGFAAQVGERALVWAVHDGRVLADAELPPRAELVTAGEAPMVRLTATRAALLTSDGLGEVEVPAGATALAGRPDGTVLVASPKGWWHMTPATVAGDPTPWEPVGSPTDQPTSAPVVVGTAGSAVVLVHPDPVRPRLVVHHDGPVVRGSFQGPYVPASNPTWAPSPSGSWGILGRSLVDVDAGLVTDLGEWRTVLVGVDQAYGMLGDDLMRAAPGSRPTPVKVRSALVEMSSPAGGLVRTESTEGTRVWTLPTHPARR
ncbi:hypothetical protein [Mobilicoccus pelagius]|uniref:Uncharacterized protein n=1 Tax=Mobilicoccus pelagius NBRC 104925 TaxID=1089455 RepID=H5UVH8_9MICO|nr:hypothetical protein [Mobilicoccus pelagius]GAB49736.1 hypothetical protein MOPEL_134_00200 [Mobilicoccus pelagius NBRC 104925]